MTLEFHLEGEVPSKKNSRINTRSGRSFPNQKYVHWHDTALVPVNLQWHLQSKKEPIKGPCALSVTFYHGDLKQRDSDNQLSSILDLLKDAGVIPDDNWKIVRKISVDNRYEKHMPGCCIYLAPLIGEESYEK